MATPNFYQTMNNVGVDPTVYYAVSASVTPETPAPPFLVGTQAFGSDGSQFIFVQASTSISLTDFVMINAGVSPNQFQANSLTITNVATSIPVGLGSAGLVLRQSVTFIPAGAFFWALTRGTGVPATSCGGVTGAMQTNANSVILYASATTGCVTSVTACGTISAAFAGIVCVNSLTLSTGIASSVIPPAGTLSATGLTVGPVVNMLNPRTVLLGGVSLSGYSANNLYVTF